MLRLWNSFCALRFALVGVWNTAFSYFVFASLYHFFGGGWGGCPCARRQRGCRYYQCLYLSSASDLPVEGCLVEGISAFLCCLWCASLITGRMFFCFRNLAGTERLCRSIGFHSGFYGVVLLGAQVLFI